MEPRENFARLIERPDEEIPLGEAALWIGAEGRPGLDVPHYLNELAAIADRARQSMAGARSMPEQIVRLNHSLFVEEGFAGNRDAYQEPENSFLDQVLERRRGIPITLSVVYIEVARQLGLDAAGIGFPGHFLAKVADDDGEIVIDPFFGRALSEDECLERLREVAGPEAELHPAMLEASSHRAILRRILTNLKHIYVSTSAFPDALACCERILLIAPDDPVEIRDRGLVLRELECFAPALVDLEHFVEHLPDHATTPAIRTLIEELAAQARRIH